MHFVSEKLTLFLIIFFLSAIFRVTNLDLIEFKTDEAVNLLLSSQPLFAGTIPFGGTVSSLGVLNPPFFNYIIFPLAAINLDPRFITFFIGLANSLAIAFLFIIIRKYYGLSIALITALLMAFSPWAILYSRKIWMQDLLIPFFVILFLSIHKLVLEKKQIFWLPYTISSLLLIQLHPISLLFIALITLTLFIQKVKINFKYIILGIVIGLIPFLPYIAYELANACPDCESLIRAQSRFSFRYAPELIMRPLQILNQGNFHFVLGSDMLTFTQSFPGIDFLRRLFYFEYILLPLGVIVFLKKYKKLRPLGISVIVLPLIYFVRKLEPFMHYYIIVLPLLFLFLAIAFNFLIFHKNILLKSSSRLLLFCIIITSIYFNYAFFNLLDSKGSFQGDYGSTFRASKKDIEKEINVFSKDSQYAQIFLSSFIPLGHMYGYEPLAKMLYPKTSAKKILELEQKLIQDSKDPRVMQEIFAYYTKTKLTRDSLEVLRQKSIDISQFKSVYEEAKRNYLSLTYKKEHTSSEFGFRFLYPEHWIVAQENGSISVTGDEVRVSIMQSNNNVDMEIIKKAESQKFERTSSKLLEQKISKIFCVEDEKKWCGIYYFPLIIEDENYFVRIAPFDEKNLPLKDNERLLSTISTVEEIIDSIR